MANSTAPKAAQKTAASGGFFANAGKFIKECYNEVRYKSAWPSPEELKQYTIVVIVAVLVVSLWIAGFDYIFSKITAWLEMLRKG